MSAHLDGQTCQQDVVGLRRAERRSPTGTIRRRLRDTDQGRADDLDDGGDDVRYDHGCDEDAWLEPEQGRSVVVEATEGGRERHVERALEKDRRDDDCRGLSGAVSSVTVSRDRLKN